MDNNFIEDYKKCIHKDTCICRTCQNNEKSGWYHCHRCQTINYEKYFTECQELDENGNKEYKKIIEKKGM